MTLPLLEPSRPPALPPVLGSGGDTKFMRLLLLRQDFRHAVMNDQIKMDSSAKPSKEFQDGCTNTKIF